MKLCVGRSDDDTPGIVIRHLGIYACWRTREGHTVALQHDGEGEYCAQPAQSDTRPEVAQCGDPVGVCAVRPVLCNLVFDLALLPAIVLLSGRRDTVFALGVVVLCLQHFQ